MSCKGSAVPGKGLSARDLGVGYDGKLLVSGVDVDVEPGRIVTLIGPNGAGKSTLLKSFAGQLAVLGGSVYVSGRPLAEMSAHDMALELSVLLTERLRTELLTCADVVEAGRYPHTGRMGILTQADLQAVREAMDTVQVWDLRDRDFMQISDGQRQRVLLARAICQQPRVMVLDEPTSYLDIRYQIELLNVLRKLAHERGLAIVASLHELALARKVSDYVICVKDGAICDQGAPEDVFTSEVIDGLYGLESGTFDPMTGAIVLEDEREGRLPNGGCDHARAR